MTYIRKLGRIVVLPMVLFFTIFSIHLKVMPIAPRIIVLVLVLLWVISSKGLKYNDGEIKWLLQCFFVFLFTFFCMFVNSAFDTEAELPLSSAFNFLIFVGLFPIFLIELFDDEVQFCQALSVACLIQSMIVILSAFSPSVRSLLIEIQNLDFSRYNFRIFGLGIAGAGGSIYLFCGLLSTAYLMLHAKTININIVILYILIFFAIALVGRTGFYAGIILSIYVILHLLQNDVKNFFFVLVKSLQIIALIVSVYAYVIFLFGSDSNLLDYTFKRLWEGFEFSNSETVKTLNRWNDQILPLSFRTFFIGTGVARGYSYDCLLVSHDGGYAKRYMSLGLLMACYSYFIYYNYIGKMLNKIKKKDFLFYLSLIIMAIIEYKEPYMFQLALPFTVLMIVKLKVKTQEKMFFFDK